MADNRFFEENFKFWSERGKTHRYEPCEGVSNSYTTFRCDGDAKGSILILTGRTEPSMKYAEVIRDLLHHGFDVTVHDHRGQGFSSRLLTNPHVGYVERFSDYSDDVNLFVSRHWNPRPDVPRYLIAHSMGGAIAAHYLIRYRDSHPFVSVALSAPMFRINTGNIPAWVAYAITTFQVCIGRGTKYALGQGDNVEPIAFEKNELTKCPKRYGYFMEIEKRFPQCRLGGVSNRWIKEAFDAKAFIRKNASSINCPLLVFLATDDTVVMESGIRAFCSRAPLASMQVVAGSAHEALMERDHIREQVLGEIVRYFESFSHKPS